MEMTGRKVAHYEILARIGAGGSSDARVYPDGVAFNLESDHHRRYPYSIASSAFSKKLRSMDRTDAWEGRTSERLTPMPRLLGPL
jgi:hypothetical protein